MKMHVYSTLANIVKSRKKERKKKERKKEKERKTQREKERKEPNPVNQMNKPTHTYINPGHLDAQP